MTKETKVREQLIALIIDWNKELGHYGYGYGNVVNGDEITDETTMLTFGVDSLDALELVMHIEDSFNIMISDEEAEATVTFKQLVELVERKVV